MQNLETNPFLHLYENPPQERQGLSENDRTVAESIKDDLLRVAVINRWTTVSNPNRKDKETIMQSDIKRENGTEAILYTVLMHSGRLRHRILELDQTAPGGEKFGLRTKLLPGELSLEEYLDALPALTEFFDNNRRFKLPNFPGK